MNVYKIVKKGKVWKEILIEAPTADDALKAAEALDNSLWDISDGKFYQGDKVFLVERIK